MDTAVLLSHRLDGRCRSLSELLPLLPVLVSLSFVSADNAIVSSDRVVRKTSTWSDVRSISVLAWPLASEWR